MAKKYTGELKSLIIEEIMNGMSCRFLSRKYNISEIAISNWQQKLCHPEKYSNQG